MLRQSTLKFKLLCAAFLAAAFYLGLNPLLRFAFVTAIEQKTGAKASMASFYTRPFDGEAFVEKLNLSELCDVETGYLRLSLSNLARQRYLIREIALSGIRLEQKTNLFGETLQPPPRKIESLESTLALFEKDPKEIAAGLTLSFKTTSLAREIENKWKSEFAHIKNDLPKIKEFVRSYQKQLEMAAKEDREMLNALSESPLDPKQLSNVFFGDAIESKLKETLNWMAQIDTKISFDFQIPNLDPFSNFGAVNRSKGTNVFFKERAQGIHLLIQALSLDGELFFKDASLNFVGKVKNFSNYPERYLEPIELHLCVSQQPASRELLNRFSQSVADMDALLAESYSLESKTDAKKGIPDIYTSVIIDRRNESKRDKWVILSPGISLPQQRFGDEGTFAIDVAPSVAKLVAIIEKNGEQIKGVIRLVDSAAGLNAEFAPSYKNQKIEKLLMTGISGLNGFDIEAKFNGTIESLDIEIDSNIGRRITSQLESAFDDQWKSAISEANRNLETIYSSSLRSVSDSVAEIEKLLNVFDALKRENRGAVPNFLRF